MAIYTSTLKKYIKSPSTWIIFLVTFAIIISLGGYVAFNSLSSNNDIMPYDYAKLAISLVAGMTAFLAIFTSVFSGFKGATMFKDEVEDGSFLVLLSKPVRRSKIILFKWIAMQTIIACYTLFSALSFMLAIIIFDKGGEVVGLEKFFGTNTLKSRVIVISLFLWMILFVSSLIFSSIALLLSTKLSVGATIGISISLGVVIPVTSLVQVFTQNQEYGNLSGKWSTNFINMNLDSLSKTADSSNDPSIKIIIEAQKKEIKALQEELAQAKKSPYYIYDLSAKNNNVNGFVDYWYFDLSFQFNMLSSFATEQIIPDEVSELIATQGRRRGPGLNGYFTEEDENNPYFKDPQKNRQQLLYAMAYTWEKNSKIRKKALTIYMGALKYFMKNSKIDVSDWDTSVLNKVVSAQNIIKYNMVTAAVVDDVSKLITTFEYDAQSNVDAKTLKANGDAIFAILNLHSIVPNVTNSQKELLKQMAFLASDTMMPTQTSVSRYYSDNNPDISRVDSKKLLPTQQEIAEIALPNDSKLKNDHPPIKNSIALKLISEGFDKERFKLTMSLPMVNQSIVKTKQTKYADKNMILYTYIGIALFLIPLSYFVIRKQDFK